MKMIFRGWGRQVYVRTYTVAPVKKCEDHFLLMDEKQSIEWFDSVTAFGKVDDLALSGNFLVEFKFTDSDIKAWMKNYVKTNPEKAFEMLAELQLECTNSPTKSPQK